MTTREDNMSIGLDLGVVGVVGDMIRAATQDGPAGATEALSYLWLEKTAGRQTVPLSEVSRALQVPPERAGELARWLEGQNILPPSCEPGQVYVDSNFFEAHQWLEAAYGVPNQPGEIVCAPKAEIDSGEGVVSFLPLSGLWRGHEAGVIAHLPPGAPTSEDSYPAFYAEGVEVVSHYAPMADLLDWYAAAVGIEYLHLKFYELHKNGVMNLLGGRVFESTFEFCQMALTMARSADIWACSFEHCEIIGGKFRGARLNGTHFYSCDLTEADFRDTTLRNVTFDNCDLTNASFDGATLRDVIWKSCKTAGMSHLSNWTGENQEQLR